MESSILYYTGLLVKLYIEWCIPVPLDFFILANSTDADEMLDNANFFLRLYYLPDFLLNGMPNKTS